MTTNELRRAALALLWGKRNDLSDAEKAGMAESFDWAIEAAVEVGLVQWVQPVETEF